jgi:hypothetical protein
MVAEALQFVSSSRRRLKIASAAPVSATYDKRFTSPRVRRMRFPHKRRRVKPHALSSVPARGAAASKAAATDNQTDYVRSNGHIRCEANISPKAYIQ